ncbi:MAG: NUDIX domain-containing protein [Candidatus Omnitrophica bacterium]|nr:NUDIX domain-containing protein [Candidatus Omnitrophota bacterium]
MPHIHKLIDFVISVFIVHQDKVLLVHHKKYNKWLPIGGHIELDENPDQALMREIHEECGLKVKILADRPKIGHSGVVPLYTPSYMDIHQISKTHRHTAFVYFGVSKSDKAVLHEREHRELKWFTRRELSHKKYGLSKSIQFYCQKSLDVSKYSQKKTKW